jgi:tetratricopeptide (TPR) repeat protein
MSAVLAYFSKESGVVTPVLLAAIFYFQKETARRYRILIPMGALALAYLALRRHAMGPLPDWTAMLPGRFFAIAFPQVLLDYLRILIVPYDLHTDRLLALPFGSAWPTALILVLGVSIWIFRKGPRWTRLCIVWYVLMFLPKSILMMSGGFMSDHWAYPAVPALALPVSWILTRAWDSPRWFRVVRGAAALILGALIAVSRANIRLRNTDEKLYRHALQYTHSETMKYNLGAVLLWQGRPEEALPYFETLSAANPQDAEAAQALAVTRQALRKAHSRR